ncbi:MAG: 1-acyl-sn-glycerol-3-phosphate acyltransferase [Bacilli bacterium]|nr:1-acyl-sn-glycerol-3-phosphate acyltransferase [Bacilli bacterium]
MKNNFGYILLTPIMRVLFRLYYNPKIIGKEVIPKKGSIVIACNHKHLFDQCLTIMATKRPIHYMAKKEYFEGHLAWFFKFVGCIPVDRSKKDPNAKSKALAVLNDGGAIGIFPEGTRNRHKDKLLLDFKFGAVSMAKKTDSLVIPCAITGDYKFRSKDLVIRYGKPFKVEGNLKEFNEKLHKEIERLLKKNLKETNRTLEKELNTHEV